MPKFPSKEKIINIKVKVIILCILKGHLLELEGALLHSLPKSEGAMAPLAPRFLCPCVNAFAKVSNPLS